MDGVITTQISKKCKVCGGDIVNDYLAGSSRCANCGNSWAIAEFVPDVAKYSGIITNINQAYSLLEGSPKTTTVNEARLAFKTTIMDCNKIHDHVTDELEKLCNEGMEKAELAGIYAKGQQLLKDGSYRSAISEFAKIPGYRDTEELKIRCEAGIKADRKKQIPLTVICSLILATASCFVMKEMGGLPWGAAIPIAVAVSAGLGFVMYLGGVFNIILKVISFLIALPLLIYTILAYMCDMSTVTSVVLAIAIPAALMVAGEATAKLTEKKPTKNTNE